MKSLILALTVGFFVLHFTAQPTYADWGWCFPPWGCQPSAPAPAKPAAPAAAPAAVVPATSKPDDFSLNSITSDCQASGLKVILEWTHSNQAETYEIHRRKVGDKVDLKTSALLSTTRAPNTRFTDSVEAETGYEYLIKAINSQGFNFSNSSEPQEFSAQACNPKAVSAQLAEQTRQRKEAAIKKTCTYLEQTDQGCIQAATANCLAISDETEQDLCIGNYRANVPTEFTLNLPTLACDAKGNGINLSWSNSYGSITYKIYRKLNKEAYKQVGQTRAIIWTDRDIQNNLLTASYQIKAVSSSDPDLVRSSNEMTFPPTPESAQTLLPELFNCRIGGPGLRTEIPDLPPGTAGAPSFFDTPTIFGKLSQTGPNQTYAPGEVVRLGAHLFNTNLDPNNGCPVTGVTFRILKENDDGTTSQVGDPHVNRPVCSPYDYTMPQEPGKYIFRVEFNGDEKYPQLGAAPQRDLPFKVGKGGVTKMVAYIDGGGDKTPIELFNDGGDYAKDGGIVFVNAKVFTAAEDEPCMIAPISLKLEKILDEKLKPLPKGAEPVVWSESDAVNCQLYPITGKVTEPGGYKLTAKFFTGARGTGLETAEAVATMILKSSGFGQATIDATIGGSGITKAKSSKSVAGVSVQKVGDELVLQNNPSVPNNTIPVRACVRPKNNPSNTQAISGVRIMVEKFDAQGNPIGEAFNEVFPNDCQQRDIEVGSPQGVGCYNFDITDEDENYEATPVSKRLCFTQTPAQAKPFTNLTIDPEPGTISSVDDPIVTVITNQFSETAHFAVLDDGKPYPVSPASSTPVYDACKGNNGDCIYRLQIYKPNGHFEVKFCHDNQNNCTDPLTFATNPTPVETDPDKIIGVGLDVGGTEIPLPFDGTSIGIDLAPLSKEPQVFRLAIHRADKSRDTFPSLTFIYDEELGATVPIVTSAEDETEQPAKQVPAEEQQAGGGNPQVCISGEYKREPTGACGGCAADAGEVRVLQCRSDRSGFDEQGGECSTDAAGPCQIAPTGQCDGDYAYWDNNALQCIYKKVTNPYPDCRYDFVPTDNADCGF